MFYQVFLPVISVIVISAFNEMPSPCNEGQEKRLSAFVYLCQNQRLVPTACMFSDDSRIPIGQTGREGDFMKSCQQTKFGGMEKKIVGCIDENGQSIQANVVFQKQGVPNKCVVREDGTGVITPSDS